MLFNAPTHRLSMTLVPQYAALHTLLPHQNSITVKSIFIKHFPHIVFHTAKLHSKPCETVPCQQFITRSLDTASSSSPPHKEKKSIDQWWWHFACQPFGILLASFYTYLNLLPITWPLCPHMSYEWPHRSSTDYLHGFWSNWVHNYVLYIHSTVSQYPLLHYSHPSTTWWLFHIRLNISPNFWDRFPPVLFVFFLTYSYSFTPSYPKSHTRPQVGSSSNVKHTLYQVSVHASTCSCILYGLFVEGRREGCSHGTAVHGLVRSFPLRYMETTHLLNYYYCRKKPFHMLIYSNSCGYYSWTEYL